MSVPRTRTRKPPSKRFRAAITLAGRYDHQEVIGLPPGAMVISNSDRKDAHCPRRWWFGHGVGLRGKPGRALRFGAAYDDVMDAMLRWYKDHPEHSFPQGGLRACPWCAGSGAWSTPHREPLVVDGVSRCPACKGSGKGPLALVEARMAERADDYPVEEGGLPAEVERLERALGGWLLTYDEDMRTQYVVRAVQATFAVPITSPHTGEVYKSKVPVVVTDEGWRLATGHDAPGSVQLVLLPWFQLVKLDAVVQRKKDGRLWTWETKTSGAPERFSADLLLDTQLPGYVRALHYVVHEMGAFAGSQVGGWLWDVTSSQPQRDPKVLQDGSYSLDAGQRVPSWRWREALATETLTQAQAEAEATRLEALAALAEATAEQWREQAREASKGKAGEEVRTQRDAAIEASKAAKGTAKSMRARAGALAMVAHALTTVDPTLYVRRWGEFTPTQLREYELELFADATRMSGWLRELAGTAQGAAQDNERVALTWPRVPLCRQPGATCSFVGVCLEDSEQARLNYDTRQPLRWLHAAGLHRQATPTPTNTTEE